MAGVVLVVDDSAEVRALAGEILGEEGIDVRAAATGAAALAAFAAHHPDSVLLDVQLPDLDGIAVCEQLRALPGGDRVAIVFITARRDVETFDRALRAGGDDFLTKPFRPGELVGRLETARRLRALTTERGALTTELKRQRDELKRLELATEQLTEFLVHDLKAPVHAIDLLAQRVMRGHDPVLGRRLREETRGLMRMITDLLDTSARTTTAHRRHVEVAPLIASAIDELLVRAQDARVRVIADAEAGVAQLDPELVLRALANLLDNAIAHAPEDSEIHVTARWIANGWRLAVRDAGPGVPPELREAIFERGVTTRGHGLGLAFCRLAATAHGGRIWVEDAAPGAAFVLELPDAG